MNNADITSLIHQHSPPTARSPSPSHPRTTSPTIRRKRRISSEPANYISQTHSRTGRHHVCITALAGCEGTPIDSSADKHTEAVTQSECSTYNAQWETCTITMPDSRRVTCIAHNSNAGISCDWAHADGADKGWTE